MKSRSGKAETGLINPDSAIEEIRMNLIQAFSPPNKVRMSIPHPCGMGLK